MKWHSFFTLNLSYSSREHLAALHGDGAALWWEDCHHRPQFWGHCSHEVRSLLNSPPMWAPAGLQTSLQFLEHVKYAPALGLSLPLFYLEYSVPRYLNGFLFFKSLRLCLFPLRPSLITSNETATSPHWLLSPLYLSIPLFIYSTFHHLVSCLFLVCLWPVEM